jgi:hypothetical protein
MPSSKTMLCDTHVCPYPGEAVQLFHDQSTVEPADTVFAAGLNALFVTDIPPAGGGVLTPEVGGGLVEALLPPHPNKHAVATAVKTCFNILSPSCDSTHAMTSRER